MVKIAQLLIEPSVATSSENGSQCYINDPFPWLYGNESSTVSRVSRALLVEGQNSFVLAQPINSENTGVLKMAACYFAALPWQRASS